MSFPRRRPPREPVARHPWEPAMSTTIRSRMDPPTASALSDATSSTPSISLSSQQLEILAQRQQKQEQHQHQQHYPPRDPSVLLVATTRPSGSRLDMLDPDPVRRLSLSSTFDNERHGTPIRTRNPVSRDSSSGSRVETPNYLARVLEKASSAVSSSSNHHHHDGGGSSEQSSLSQKMMRQTGSSYSSNNNKTAMKRSDRVAITAALRDRMRRGRKEEPKAPVTTASVDTLPMEQHKTTKSNQELPRGELQHTLSDQSTVQRPDNEIVGPLETHPIDRALSYGSTASLTEDTDAMDHYAVKEQPTDSITEASDGSEEEPEGYSDFVEILQAEVSGQHSQLWSSFRAVMSGEEPPAPTVVRPLKSFKFDSKTKSALNAMNMHLKEHAPVDCINTTQLVNDKKIAKELVAQMPSLATSSSLEESCLTGTDPISRSRSSYSEAGSGDGGESPHEDDVGMNGMLNIHGARSSSTQRQSDRDFACRRQDASDIDKITTMRTMSKDESTASSQQSRSSPPRLHTRTFSNEQWGMSPSRSRANGKVDPIVTMRSDSCEDNESHKLYGNRKLDLTETLTCSTDAGMDEEKKETDSPYARVLPSPAGTAAFGENDSNPGLEVTLGQFNSKYPKNAPLSVAPGEATTWTNVKLKSSQPTKQLISSLTESNDGTALPVWATLKLRHVSQDEVPFADSEDSPTSLEQPVEPTPCSTTLSAELASSIGTGFTGPDNSVIEPTRMENETKKPFSFSGNCLLDEIMTAALPSSNETTQSVVTASKAGDRVEQARSYVDEAKNIESTPSDIRIGNKIDEATVIRLKDTPGLKKDFIARVIVGGKLLMVAHSEAGNPRARVLWKLPRSEISSLALDMSSLTIDVILTSGEHKFLSFTSSEDCLKFANVFYSMKTEAELESVKSPAKSDNSLVDDSIHVESLNDEEHNVLETFRRLRRSKDVEEALNESIKFESASDHSMSGRVANPAVVEQARPTAAFASAAVQTGNELAAILPPSVVNADKHPSSPVSAMSLSIGSNPSLVENYKKLLQLKIGTKIGPKPSPDFPVDTSGLVPPEQRISPLTDDEETVASSYRKMLRLNFPHEVVLHRMKKEGASDKIVKAVLGCGDSIDSQQASTSALTAEEETTADSYRRMLKLGIEKEAVRHKMLKDTVPMKIIAVVVGDSSSIQSETFNSNDTQTEAKSSKSNLSNEEESLASSYRKMLKLQIPKGKVFERMTQDGISEKIIIQVMGRAYVSSQSSTKSIDVIEDAPSQSNQLVSLHWTVLSGKELDQSVWKAANINGDEDEIEPERNDISKLIDLFQKKSTIASTRERPVEDNAGGNGKAKILDLTRSNNIAISLKAFKDFTTKELADILAYIDPLRRIRGERVQFLKGLLPTVPEIASIRAYDGPDDKLTPAERWFRQIQDIERIEQKVKVLRTMETFEQESKALVDSLKLLTTVCKQVMDSEKLQVLLGMVLRIGNVMNEGTRTGRAAGFKMDSLLKLTQTKSSDGKMTVLDFLVEVFVEKGQRQTLDLSSEFPECHSASRMVIGDLLAETKNLKDALQVCQDELNILTRFDEHKKPKDVAGSSAAAMAATVARGDSSGSPSGKVKLDGFAQRDHFLSILKDQSKIEIISDAQEDVKGGTDVGSLQNSVDGGTKRLMYFITEGDKLFAELDSARKKALSESKELSRYCGEGYQTGPTTTLLGILAQFASNLNVALAKYDQREAAKSRMQRRRGDDTPHTSASIKTLSTSVAKEPKDKGASLIVLVNDMLKNANERTIEDFKKGRVNPNPSSNLKAIYEREKRLAPSTCSSPRSLANRRQLDIIAAIKERGNTFDQREVGAAPALTDANASQKDQQMAASPLKRAHQAEIDTSCGIQQARAMFENLILRPTSPEFVRRSPAKQTPSRPAAGEKEANVPTEKSTVIPSLVTMKLPADSIDQAAPETVPLEAVEEELAGSEGEASLPDDGQDSIIRVEATIDCSTEPRDKITVEATPPRTLSIAADAAAPAHAAAPISDSKPPMLLSEARKARALLEKAVSRPQTSALLPLVSARRLSGKFDRKAPVTREAVQSNDDVALVEEETKEVEVMVETETDKPTTSPIKHERKSIGELARERRAVKSYLGSVEHPAATLESNVAEQVLAIDNVNEPNPAKATLLDMAYMKRESRRMSVGANDNAGAASSS